MCNNSTFFFHFIEHCEITGIENLSNNQSTRVNCNEKLSSSTETYVVDELQRSISLNDGTVS